MKTLNLVMIVKNEQRCLERCLNSVKDLVDQIILVDTGSTDRTREIALAYGAKVFEYTWNGDFSAARNFALDQSHSDWNLVLDADEYLNSGTRNDLKAFMENPKQLGAIQTRNAYMEDGEIAYGISYTTRLLPGDCRFTGRIHEQVCSDYPRRPLPLVFDHDGYLQKGKEERNLPALYRELEENPDDSYYLYHVASSLRNMKQFDQALPYFERFYRHAVPTDSYYARGMVAYLYTLLEKKEWKQGLALIEQEEEHLQTYTDFWFACGIFYMKLVLADTAAYISYLPRIEQCYQNCLKLGEHPERGGVLGTGSFKAAYNLGTWYEVSGNPQKALSFYSLAAGAGYEPAQRRLKQLSR